MKVLAIIIVICAVAFAAVPPKVPAQGPIGANSTSPFPINATAPANSSVPVAREGRFLALRNNFYYDRAYDVVLDSYQYNYVVSSPVYKTITRDIEIIV